MKGTSQTQKNIPKKKVILARLSNIVTNQMAVETHAKDEVISTVDDSQTPITSAFFHAELATKICKHGLIFQLRQGILIRKTA